MGEGRRRGPVARPITRLMCSRGSFAGSHPDTLELRVLHRTTPGQIQQIVVTTLVEREIAIGRVRSFDAYLQGANAGARALV